MRISMRSIVFGGALVLAPLSASASTHMSLRDLRDLWFPRAPHTMQDRVVELESLDSITRVYESQPAPAGTTAAMVRRVVDGIHR